MTTHKLGIIIASVGILLILGALGAVDCGTITVARFFISLVFRVPLTLVGLHLSGYDS